MLVILLFMLSIWTILASFTLVAVTEFGLFTLFNLISCIAAFVSYTYTQLEFFAHHLQITVGLYW